ncbi:MAG: VTT domain-containing protein [Thiobacillus sp.]|nr:VTT domain-containing protein [Gammaproteobacteria bacterium]MDO9007815.1 VTT domain-containing protein [Thiobacillus sp.]MDP1925491.1 VTT domain-containing protein [Thiobacillus sp.]
MKLKHDAPNGLKSFRLFVLMFLFIVSFALLTYGLRIELFAGVVWIGETIREAPVLGAIVFFFASAFSVLFLFLSSVLLIPSAILAWGKWLTFLLLAAGWLCGWMATYAIGRFFRDRTFVENRLNEQHLKNTFFLSKKLPFSLVLIVISSLPAEIVGYALGTVRYPFWSFLLALALVEIPFAFLLVFIGETFFIENVGLLIGLMVLLLGIFIWEVKNARRLKAAMTT